MKLKEEGPMVAVLFKGLAIGSAVLALWFFGKSLLGDRSKDTVAQAVDFGVNIGHAISLTAGGLCLWWMGEVIDLLAKIVENGIAFRQTSAPSKTITATPAKSGARTENPPSYKI